MTEGSPYFKVDVQAEAGTARVIAAGELDAAAAGALEGALASALEGDVTSVVLDLAAVSFIDSSGLRVVTAALGAAEEKGATLAIDAASDAVRRIFEITGLTSLLA